MNGTKLVVNASSLLLATARARCVFVHFAVSVRLPSPRALRCNLYIYQASLCESRHLLETFALFLQLGTVTNTLSSYTCMHQWVSRWAGGNARGQEG